MFNFHKDHRQLLLTIFLVFFGLSMLISVIPAYQMQENNAPLPSDEPMTPAQVRGMQVFVSEGCVACHTQQVRSIEMDKTWGSRPSIPSDYYYSKQRMGIWRQSPSLLGSERTGPDLTNVGQRQPGEQWHLLHLYNPRIVSPESVMPAYPWLFVYHSEPEKDVLTIDIPEEFRSGQGKVVATQKALDLVAYLTSLKQAPLPGEVPFIPAKTKKVKTAVSEENGSALPDGAQLYQANCSACHQGSGKGIPGAFPPLAGSKVVNDKDPELLVKIILHGYDARKEFGIMPPFGTTLSDEEIAAIASHERSSWGNDAPPLTAQQVADIRKLAENLTP